MGRPEDAVRAFAKSIELLGPSDERYAGLGEAQVYASGGVVTAEAKHSFEQALALNPKVPRGLFYSGLAAQQDGNKDKARDFWQQLVAVSPADAPWLPTIRERLASLSGETAPKESGSKAQGGEDGGQAKMAAAVQAMPDDQREAMIHRMVDGLAERLKSNGNDLDGWLRLVRAYRVLDEPDKAKDALAGARRNFAADADAKKKLDDLARELGIEG
jgi:cytochrome c-type biogenesis protein CcmH